MSPAESSDTHATAGELLGWLDGELSAGRARWIEAHVAACDRCRAEANALRARAALFAGAARMLGGDPPPDDPRAVVRRAARRRFARVLSAAAALLILVSGTLFAIARGGPAVRDWLDRRFADPAPDTAPAADSADGAAGPMVDRLVATAPDSLDLVVQPPAHRLEVRIARAPGTRLRVMTGADARPARLEFGENRLLLDAGAARRVRIVLPRESRGRIVSRAEVLFRWAPVPDGPNERDDPVSVLVVEGTATGDSIP
ncbi:MAG: zf-HC2 domain-containing protein [Gemmatimonadota bacterium]